MAQVLAGNNHRAFPVVEQTAGGSEVFKGIILRNHVLSILAKEALYMDEQNPAVIAKAPSLAFEQPRAHGEGGGGDGGITNAQMEAMDADELVNLDDKVPLTLVGKNDGEKRALLARCVVCVHEMRDLTALGLVRSLFAAVTRMSHTTRRTYSPPFINPDDNEHTHTHNRLQKPEYQHRFVTLAPYIDQSSYRIPPTFSLERGFNL